jgi:hypothetical protein
MAADCCQSDAIEFTLDDYNPRRAAFAMKMKSPPRLQRIDMSRVAEGVTPLTGRLPLPAAGIIDSGASCTIFNSLESIPDAKPLVKQIPFRTSGKEVVYATHQGTCDVVIVNTEDGVPVRWRSHALFGPFSASLFTLGTGGFATRVKRMTPAGKQVINVVTHDYDTRQCTGPDVCLVADPRDTLLNIFFHPSQRVLPAHLLNWGAMALATCYATTSFDSGRSLEARLGLARLRMLSPCDSKVRLLLQRTGDTGFLPPRVPLPTDPVRSIANLREGPFPPRTHKPLSLTGAARDYVTRPGTLYLDLFGPCPPAPDPFNGGREVQFGLVARHEENCLTRVYPVWRKSDSLAALRQHMLQYGAPHVICSDNGGEFRSTAMDELRREFGVARHDRTVPENSHQNPAERAIQTVNSFARKVFAASNVREDMWPLAVQMGVYVHNIHTNTLGCTASQQAN